MQEEALKGYRLSPQQRHLWTWLRQDRNGTYQTKCGVKIKGRLELRRLKTAVRSVIASHEILRTTFQCLPGMTIPMQVIDETGDVLWQETDLSGSDEQASLIKALLLSNSHHFDFERGPLLSIHLVKKAEDEHVMIVGVPAICADAVSLQNLVAELGLWYVAAAEGRDLGNDVAQYADLAEWLNRLVETEETRIGREYWHKLSLQRPPAPQLVFNRAPAGEAAFEPRLDRLIIEPTLTERIESFAGSMGTSLQQVLSACWYTLLWRYSGQPEIEVGTLFDGRDFTELKGALGLFAKYLPLTCRMGEDTQFGELVRHIDKSFQAAGDWKEYFSWEQFTAQTTDGSSDQFFPYCFEPEAEPADIAAGDLSLTIFRQYSCIDRFKIKLSYARRASGLIVEFNYDSELLHPADIRSLISHFHQLLESAIADPTAKISDLEVITEVERRQLLVGCNSTKTEWERNRFAHELFLEQVERTPEAIAVIHEDERLTYRELSERAARLAYHLRELGVGPDAPVGLFMERSSDLVVALLAVLMAGGAYLPLEPSSPPGRLSFMLEDAAVTVLLTQARLYQRLPVMEQARIICIDTVWESISQNPAHCSFETLLPDNLAYIIYTSGSTGRPKGVMLRHRSLRNYLLWVIGRYPLNAGCGAPVHSSFCFDLTITSLFAPLMVGGYVHLLSDGQAIEALGAALNEHRGYSLAKLTPAHLQLLAEQLTDSDLDGVTHSFVIGGEILPAKTVRWWREKAPAIRLFNEYGPTESVVGCCVYEVGTKEEAEKNLAAVPIGRPIANTSLYILDERQQLAPQGVVGELCIGGEGLARGYLNRADLTAEKFAPAPYSTEPGERLYRTGDLARYLDDEEIECLGRRDDQVKVRGYRIEPGEIEAILNEHGSVRQSVVVAIDDERGAKRLLGYVVGEEDASSAGLKRYIRERLPEYMTPEAIIMLEAMPITANGKIDRKRLPMMEGFVREPGQEYAAPRTPVEEVVAGIFEEVLKLDRIGRYDNFFEVGGHSLLAMQVVSRVRKTFGVEIGVRSVFEKPTAEGLASRIEEAMRVGEKVEMPPLVRASREGQKGMRLPLSFAQQRLWFLNHLAPNNPSYNIPGALALEGELKIEVLERSVNEIVRRHEVLRTRFELEEGEPVQVIDEWKYRRLWAEDLTRLTREEREVQVSWIVSEEARTGFDLSKGPLLRVKVLKLEEERHVLLFTMHHIVSDGWSMGILSREIGALYQAYAAGKDSPLEELPIQYADFAVWQRGWLSGEALENHLAYWKQRLGGEAPALKLPTDRPRPAMPTSRGAQRSHPLPTSLSNSLKALSLKQGCTLFMTLLAGFKTLLYYLTGQTDIWVGTDIANRNLAETEKLIGFFVNQLVLRAKLSPDSTFEELLRTVREHTLGAYAHQDLPFEKLVETLNPDRDMSRTPLFQVKMTLQNAPVEELSMPGLTLSPINTATDTAKTDLSLILSDAADGLNVLLLYNVDLFEEGTPIRILNRFHTLLDRITQRPDAKLQELVDSLFEEDKCEQFEKKKSLESVRLRKLKSVKRKAIDETPVEAER